VSLAMWAHPGRQLPFMGGEIAQNDEWRYNASVDWHLLEYPEHAGVQRLVRELDAVYRDQPALWEQDFDWSGFRWIDPNDADHSVLSFIRFPVPDQRVVACIANLTPVVRTRPSGRAASAGSVGRDPQYRQHPVRRQRRHRRRPHRRADRLERPGALRRHDASPVGRRLAGAPGVARAYPARKLLLCHQAATGFTASAGSPSALLR